MNTTIPGSGATHRRIHELDAVRGFALLGLIPVNLTVAARDAGFPRPSGVGDVLIGALFDHRFATIFCFLFGVSFALILRSATGRAPRPRLVLLRRLVVLLGISIGQIFLVDGNPQLAIYATLGMVVLLPASFLPRSAVLIAGLAALLASMPAGGPPYKLVLEYGGLLLLGTSTVQFGIPESLQQRGRTLAVVFAASAITTVALTPAQGASTPLLDETVHSLLPKLTALAYITGLLLLLRTPLRRLLAPVLEPMGRTALSNFLLQGLAITTLPNLLDMRGWNYGLAVFGLSAVVLIAEALLSMWWLRHFRYGPIEWIWRCLTWLDMVPLRKQERPAHRRSRHASPDVPEPSQHRPTRRSAEPELYTDQLASPWPGHETRRP